MAFYTLNQILDIGTLHRLSYISIFIIQKDVEYAFSYSGSNYLDAYRAVTNVLDEKDN